MSGGRLAETRLGLAAQPLLWPLAALVAARGGVLRVPGVGIVVADVDLAREVLRDDASFTKNGPRTVAAQVGQVLGPSALLNMDGPEQRRVRRALAPAFAPERVDRIAAQTVEALAPGLLRELAAGRAVDLVPFARELAGRLTFALLGTEPTATGDPARACGLAERLAAHGGIHGRPLSAAEVAAARATRDQLVARATASGATDGAGALACVQGLGLPEDDAAGLVAALAMAATQTLVVALPRIAALVLDAGQLPAVAASPERALAVVDEGFRLTTPLPATVRVAARDTRIGERRVAAGRRVLVLTYAAARSRRHFAHPARLDPGRDVPPDARNVAFGSGPHACPGALLARRAVQHVLLALATAPVRPVVRRRRAVRRALLPAYARLAIGAGA